MLQTKNPGKHNSDATLPLASPQVTVVSVTSDDVGQRLDNFLFRTLRGVPKSRVYRALRNGEVRVNKKRCKAEYRLAAEDLLRIPPLRVDERPAAAPVRGGLLQELEQAILFENDLVLVVNKPAGLAVHGGSGVDYGLIEAVRKMRPECPRIELAHRLDRDTSGCTILTKKSSALRSIHQQLREKTMTKTYLALVKGRWPRRKTWVDAPLEKNVLKSGERMVKVSPDGKTSQTRFQIREVFEAATLVEASPVTGRTHQIRVHAQHAGFPLCGDDKYGNREDDAWLKSIGLKRLFLHASSVTLSLPGRDKPLTIEAPLPVELEVVLDTLREGSQA
jgi:23S rRNA pseudouridine955/2504/2580 synthase